MKGERKKNRKRMEYRKRKEGKVKLCKGKSLMTIESSEKQMGKVERKRKVLNEKCKSE